MANWIPIFKVGKYPQGEYTEEDLRAIVESYDPGFHEAPAVIGHPKDNAPAYGWVENLKAENGILYAQFKQIDPEFAKMINKGRFKKISISLYQNGKPYLRHVGFLGAMPPQVKGLPDARFKDDWTQYVEIELDSETLEFAATEEEKEAQRRRSKKYGIAIKEGGHVTKPKEYAHLRDDQFADPVNYRYPIDEEHIRAALSYWGMPRNRAQYSPKEQAIITARIEAAAKKFGIGKYKKEVKKMQEFEELLKVKEQEFQEKLKEKEQELEKLQKEAQTFKEEKEKLETEIQKLKDEKLKNEIKSFTDKLLHEGKFVPAWKDMGILTFMEELAREKKIVEFSEDKKQSLYDWFKNFLEELPKVVEFKEIAKKEDETKLTDFPVEKGEKIDEERLELHRKAKAFAEKHKVSYEEALRAVSSK
jgi:tRNA A37 N6-isopentenylltransferase MiaA